jgi:hypothetical protein
MKSFLYLVFTLRCFRLGDAAASTGALTASDLLACGYKNTHIHVCFIQYLLFIKGGVQYEGVDVESLIEIIYDILAACDK